MRAALWKSERPCWVPGDDATDPQEVRPSEGRRPSGSTAPRRWSLQKVEPLEIGLSGGRICKGQ